MVLAWLFVGFFLASCCGFLSPWVFCSNFVIIVSTGFHNRGIQHAIRNCFVRNKIAVSHIQTSELSVIIQPRRETVVSRGMCASRATYHYSDSTLLLFGSIMRKAKLYTIAVMGSLGCLYININTKELWGRMGNVSLLLSLVHPMDQSSNLAGSFCSYKERRGDTWKAQLSLGTWSYRIW